MFKVKIYGAGSIGNHLAHACRNKNWAVTMCDLDQAALDRTKIEIFPERYGAWDTDIQLITPQEQPDEQYDLIIIGTPPDSHNKLAIQAIKQHGPKVVLIEKPLCGPDLTDAEELLEVATKAGTFVGIGYNHRLTQNTKMVEELIKNDELGEPLSIMAKTREHWGGIFGAHPWLSGPEDTYLGFYKRGGGACGEHSHAINIWQHFAEVMGVGRIQKVTAVMDMVKDGTAEYDQLALLAVTTEKGFVGNIIQDVITEPAQKQVRIQGKKGFIEWYVNIDSSHDAIRSSSNGKDVEEVKISKVRPDDFKGEIDHMEQILKGEQIDSPISMERGLDTMLVIAASYISNQQRKEVTIDYSAGYSLNAIKH
jgi:predicted dehydrogenase